MNEIFKRFTTTVKFTKNRTKINYVFKKSEEGATSHNRWETRCEFGLFNKNRYKMIKISDGNNIKFSELLMFVSKKRRKTRRSSKLLVKHTNLNKFWMNQQQSQ